MFRRRLTIVLALFASIVVLAALLAAASLAVSERQVLRGQHRDEFRIKLCGLKAFNGVRPCPRGNRRLMHFHPTAMGLIRHRNDYRRRVAGRFERIEDFHRKRGCSKKRVTTPRRALVDESK